MKFPEMMVDMKNFLSFKLTWENQGSRNEQDVCVCVLIYMFRLNALELTH